MWLAHKTLPPRTARLLSVVYLLKKRVGQSKPFCGVWLSLVLLKTKTNKQMQPPEDLLSSANPVNCWDVKFSSGKAKSTNAASPSFWISFAQTHPVTIGRTSGKRECFIDFMVSCLHILRSLREEQANKPFQGWSFVYFSFLLLLLFFFLVFSRLAWRI